MKKKKGRLKTILAMAVMVLIGGICGALMAKFAISAEESGRGIGGLFGTLAILLIGFYLGFFLHIAIHEAGHLVGGLITGYQFSSYRIGSMMWMKGEDGKIHRKKLKIAGTGGQCLMCPPDMVDGKIPYVIYNLGGSLANGIVSLILLGIWLLLGRESVIATLCLIIAMVGLLTAAMNGIPLRTGMVDNDGYNAMSLGKNPAALRAFWIQMKGNEMISRGIRTKEMPEEWFEIPSDEDLKNTMVAPVAVLACGRLMDQLKFEEADALMEKLLAMETGIAGIHKNLLVCERIYCELIGENRKEVLEGFLTKEQKQFMKSMKKFPSVLRVQYVYALLGEKDPEKAAKELEKFEKTAKTYPYPSEIENERELIGAADEIYKQRLEEETCPDVI